MGGDCSFTGETLSRGHARAKFAKIANRHASAYATRMWLRLANQGLGPETLDYKASIGRRPGWGKANLGNSVRSSKYSNNPLA